MSKKKQAPQEEEPREDERPQEPEYTVEQLTEALQRAAEVVNSERARAEEYQSDYRRLLAEFDNYKRRNAEAGRKAREEAAAETAERFLPIGDAIERAMELIRDAGVRSGLEMVLKKLDAVLTEQGITEIPALGAPFDPSLHNALETVGTDKPELSDTVAEVLMKGYAADGRVIRHSLVKVAKYG